MEIIFVFFVVGIVITVAFVGFELLEGFWSLNAFDGDDEEWIAPLAVFSLLAYLMAILYFG